MLEEAEDPLERFNREIVRRTDVVCLFPDDASVLRLVSMLAIESQWRMLVGRACIKPEVDGTRLGYPV